MNSSETVLRYNGVLLRNCQTLLFSEDPILDPSGMNIEKLKTRIRVVGYFSAAENSFFGSYPQIETPPSSYIPGAGLKPGADSHYMLLHSFLNDKRKELQFYITDQDPLPTPTGRILHHAIPAPSTISGGAVPPLLFNHEVNGGPTPKSINITHLTGKKLFRVEFEIESCLNPPCERDSFGDPVSITADGDANDQFPAGLADSHVDVYRQFGVLSNRWSCTDSVDDNRYLVRTFAGQVRLANPNWNPHDYRNLTVAPLSPGMRRDRVEYKASEDGLSLQYTVVDKEVTITAPIGCTNVSIKHRESMEGFGHIVNVSLQIQIKGERVTSKHTMFRIAFAIAESKLQLSQKIKEDGEFSIRPIRLELSSNEGTDQDNSVTFIFIGQRHPVAKADLEADLSIASAVSGAMYTRTRHLAGTALEDYNNQRSRGNRTGEVPDADVPIPPLAALHAVLTSRCNNKFTLNDASQMGDSEQNAREAMWNALKPTEFKPEFDMESIYALKYPEFLVEIVEGLEDVPSQTFSDSTYDAVYTTYRISSTYDANPMSLQLPFSGQVTVQESPGAPVVPSPTSAMVRLGPTQYRRQIIVEAERYGMPPNIPSPVDVFYEESVDGVSAPVVNKLIHHTMPVETPEIAPDGKGRLYTVRAEYLYALNRNPLRAKLGIPEYEKAASSSSGSSDSAPFTVLFSELYDSSWTIGS